MRLALTAACLILSAACDEGGDPIEPPTAGDTTRIVLVGHGLASDRFTAEVAARGDFAYTTTWGNRAGIPGDLVRVWNVSGATPVQTDSLLVSDASTLGDIQISADGTLLVVATEHATGSIVIYDLTDPAHPQFIARHQTENTHNAGVHTVKLGRVDGVLYAFLSVNPGNSHRAQLVIVDLSDPAAPQEVLVRQMGSPFVHDVFVRDGLLFTALWNDGMTIWDIGGGGRGGTPSNPVEISNIRTVGSVNPAAPSVHNIWWFHDPSGENRYVFVGEEGPLILGSQSSGDIHVVDISDIDNPREVAFYHVPGAGTHNFVMDEESGVLYAAYYSGGVRAIDVSGDLADCSSEHRAADGRCDLRAMGREVGTALSNIGQVSIWGVARVGANLYASDMLSGIFKLDISALVR